MTNFFQRSLNGIRNRKRMIHKKNGKNDSIDSTKATTVSFDMQSNRAYFVPNAKEIYTDQIWYTKEEQTESRKERNEILQIMKDQKMSEQEMNEAGYCTRGLESRGNKVYHRQILKNRYQAHSVIHEESMKHSITGMDHSEITSKLYALCCLSSKSDALERAHLDAKVAQEIYEEDAVKEVARVTLLRQQKKQQHQHNQKQQTKHLGDAATSKKPLQRNLLVDIHRART